MKCGEGHTRMVRGGKKSGTSIFSRLWYFFARAESNCPYAAFWCGCQHLRYERNGEISTLYSICVHDTVPFAGRLQGGLFPLPTFTPPRKIGMKL